ncbi:MAG: F0F1 ATP synthase subunit B [Clostridia bacterium]|nr:F0F1 ATP synthase subunit B [Clostridia bacterium]
MQNLDVISINLWDVLISLCNLALLYFMIKKFLYKPVKKMLISRQETIDKSYKEAEDAANDAKKAKEAYEEKLLDAKKESDSLIQSAVNAAQKREEEIIADAKTEAEGIVNRAKEEASLEIKKAEQGMKEEIVKVGTLLAEKMLEREINEKDHEDIIDSFIEKIGGGDEGNN